MERFAKRGVALIAAGCDNEAAPSNISSSDITGVPTSPSGTARPPCSEIRRWSAATSASPPR